MNFKRFTVFIVVLCVIAFRCALALAEGNLTLDVRYDPREHTLTVSGESDEFVIVTVTEESVDYSTLYDGQPSEFQYIVPQNGQYSYTFDITDVPSPAKYKVSATTYTQKTDSTFICYSFDDAQTTFEHEMKGKEEDAYIEAFKTNAYAFGIELDQNISEEFQSEIFRLMYACNTKDGFEVYNDYQKSVLYAELNMKSKEETEDFINQNSHNLNIDFEKEWSDRITDDIKESVLSAVSDYDFANLLADGNKSFSDFLDEVFLTQKSRNVQSWLELKNIITDDYNAFFKEILSSKDYSSVNNKDSIFMSLIEYKSEFDTHQKIADKLYDCIYHVIEEEDRLAQSSSHSGGGGGGGKTTSVNIQSGYTSPPAPQPAPNTTETIKNTISFNDVDKSHWCYDDISTLYELGIINGYSESSFCPENNVTRAEFVKMIISALGIEPQNSAAPFSDVSDSDWFSSYVGTAYADGIIKGDGNTFYPGKPITREDASVMIFRAAHEFLASSDIASEFSDKKDISLYAVDAINALSGIGIINGYEDGTFRPSKEITRAESVRIISNIINLMK